MVILYQGFVFDDVADGGMWNKKKAADERQSTKNGSKNKATDGGNKKNVAVVAKEPKVAPVEPMVKIVQASDGTQTKRRADHDHGAPAIAPAPPRGTDFPSAKHSATSQPLPSPLLQQAVVANLIRWRDKPVARTVQWTDTNPDDYKQLPSSSPRLQARTKVSSLQPVKGSGGDGHSNKKLLDKLDIPSAKHTATSQEINARLEEKTRKKVEIISPLPKKDTAPARDRNPPADRKPKEVEVAKNEGEKKDAAPAADAGAKKDDGNDIIVLKMDMHCEGCAKKYRQAIRNFKGVEDVKADISNHTLTVTGKVDPAKIKARLEEKTRKKVDIISPLPKKDAAPAGDKKPPADEKKEEDKKPKQTTVVLKIRLHCHGCIQNIRKLILKIKGVDSVNIEAAKDLVAVTGTMDVKELAPSLKEKLKRGVEVVPPPTKKDGGGADKKEGKDSGGGDKKEGKEAGGGDKKDGKEAPAPAPAPAATEKEEGGDGSKTDDGYVEPPASVYAHAVHEGYSHYPQYPVDPWLHAPQMFSDENPNACSVM
ncbi:heavy metal-associated isoprenylated plant protein 5-like isoform X2 [Punica granatum]|uniref:Heavy metal-associated isoprenylated plant protein 5-like isoform X2 n=1 Tax=Punica granatum TaxID=22663 RepID=A0A6P8DQ20_PUNGR|nr:heavy metal-associated isoprenylated plant protein 5-like isoform X2 [Punica granatum]